MNFMDPFEDIVQTMGVESSLFVRLQLRAPWGVSFDTGYQARIVMISRGACSMTSQEASPVSLSAGDCLIVRAGVSFALEDTAAGSFVTCESIASSMTNRTIRYGGEGRSFEMVSARLSFDPEAGAPLMEILPQLLHVHLGDGEAHLLQTTLQLIGMETAEEGLGAGLLIQRLTDVLFVQAIRVWLAKEQEQPATGWLAGLKDRSLSVAMKAMHDDIARPWTVAQLARAAGLSRSSFALTFKAVVGDTPSNYLTQWRMYRAKALLRAGNSLAQIASSVGYESESALSRAFKRAEGIAPGIWRTNLHRE